VTIKQTQTHPMTPIVVEGEVLPAYEHVQVCAQTLVTNGLMSVMEHKKFTVRLERWLRLNNVNFNTKHR
jgi:hypothetical protein